MPYIVKKTLQKIVESENHYVVKVKANQPKLLKAVKETVENTIATQRHIKKEKNRGREETRTTSIFMPLNNLPDGWPTLNRIVFVQREFTSKGKHHKTDSYYITDLKADDAKYIAEGIRGHWYIENKLHYTKDVSMREDKTSTKDKKAASNLAIFRDVVFNILKTYDNSIKYATEYLANKNVKELIYILLRT